MLFKCVQHRTRYKFIIPIVFMKLKNKVIKADRLLLKRVLFHSTEHFSRISNILPVELPILRGLGT